MKSGETILKRSFENFVDSLFLKNRLKEENVVVKKNILFLGAILMLAGCASSQMKQRKLEREKISQTAKIYCDFVNGEIFPDIEVALNLEMAKRCDSDKSLSITNYKTPSENVGVMYCCSIKAKDESSMLNPLETPKKEEPKSDKK